jgi:hypothetical protein
MLDNLCLPDYYLWNRTIGANSKISLAHSVKHSASHTCLLLAVLNLGYLQLGWHCLLSVSVNNSLNALQYSAMSTGF